MQISTKRIVEFSPEHFPDVRIGIKPATGPERASYLGDLGRDGANIGDIANAICRKHVVSAEGTPREFNRTDQSRFNEWEPDWIMDVMAFVVKGCQLSEADAKNSE